MSVKITVDRPLYNDNNAMQKSLRSGETLKQVEKWEG
jgi:hypothetical protein